MTEPIIPGLDDDDVLLWWELYDSGLTLNEVAESVTVHPSIIELALGREGLNVLGTARLKSSERLSMRLVRRALAGHLNEHDQIIYDAMARMRGVDDEGSTYPRHLSVADALPHAKPNHGKHSYHPLSERQRRMDRLAPARWRKIVQQNLRRAGLIGR